jgi:hypothetical protein
MSVCFPKGSEATYVVLFTRHTWELIASHFEVEKLKIEKKVFTENLK